MEEEKEYIASILKDINDKRALMLVVKYLEAVKYRSYEVSAMDRELYKRHIIDMLDSLNDTKLKIIYNIVMRYWLNSPFENMEANHE